MSKFIDKIPIPILSALIATVISIPSFGLLYWLSGGAIEEFFGSVIGVSAGTAIGGFIGERIFKRGWQIKNE